MIVQAASITDWRTHLFMYPNMTKEDEKIFERSVRLPRNERGFIIPVESDAYYQKMMRLTFTAFLKFKKTDNAKTRFAVVKNISYHDADNESLAERGILFGNRAIRAVRLAGDGVLKSGVAMQRDMIQYKVVTKVDEVKTPVIPFVTREAREKVEVINAGFKLGSKEFLLWAMKHNPFLENDVAEYRQAVAAISEARKRKQEAKDLLKQEKTEALERMNAYTLFVQECAFRHGIKYAGETKVIRVTPLYLEMVQNFHDDLMHVASQKRGVHDAYIFDKYKAYYEEVEHGDFLRSVVDGYNIELKLFFKYRHLAREYFVFHEWHPNISCDCTCLKRIGPTMIDQIEVFAHAFENDLVEDDDYLFFVIAKGVGD